MWWCRFAIWPRVRAFIEAIPLGGLVADVGCGNGKYFTVRPDLMVVGSDRSPGEAHCSPAACLWLRLQRHPHLSLLHPHPHLHLLHLCLHPHLYLRLCCSAAEHAQRHNKDADSQGRASTTPYCRSSRSSSAGSRLKAAADTKLVHAAQGSHKWQPGGSTPPEPRPCGRTCLWPMRWPCRCGRRPATR